MIDDDEEDVIITRDIISGVDCQRYSLDWSPDYKQGLGKVLERKHDVYLVDYHLGVGNGLELIRESVRNRCDGPFILLTGENTVEIDHRAMEAGAADFLVKGEISSRQLSSSIRYSMERARILRELKSLNASLENRVKERTLVLEEAVNELNKTQRELGAALAKEKELNELKSRFVTMASHEFRTPLATILSSLSLVAKYSEQNNMEKQARHVSRIKSAVNHLTDLLNDVLSIGRLEEGMVAVSYQLFNIRELAQESIQDMQLIAKKNQQILLTHSGKEIVNSDKKMVKHILLNLVSNAIKFSAEGKPVNVEVRTEDSRISLSIRDQGIGISEDDQKHLCERFFRGQNATNIQGTGLGLNIVSRYAELLNGSIECRSRLGEGTEFIVAFPEGKS